ncbi:hypothetical protein HY405_01935 [Candidatus Microgenomates bacterium]|nr:hypothetical protein [Candidatus Microgenomates bacterium]
MPPIAELSAEQFQNFRKWVAEKKDSKQRTVPPQSAFDITTEYLIDDEPLNLRSQTIPTLGPRGTVIAYNSEHSIAYGSVHTEELQKANVVPCDETDSPER